MNITIESLGIHYYGGGRTATLNLLRPLFKLDQRNHYRILLTQPEPTLNNLGASVQQIIVPIRNRMLLRLWAQFAIPYLTRTDDLVHFIKNMGIIGLRKRYIVTMYDMTTVLSPELFPVFDVWYWKHIQKITLENAWRIISISNNTAADIKAFYGKSYNQIRVVNPGISEIFHPSSPEEILNVRAKYGLPDQYFIHVGRIDRKKNLTPLIEGLGSMHDFTGSIVLVGKEYPKSKDENLQPTIKRLGLTNRVIFTGPVPDYELAPLYSGAIAAVYPSLHEGFGLAPLEAMACGTPLIAHKAGAVAEVVGNSGVILDEVTPASFGYEMMEMLRDTERRSRFRKRGLERAALYSPEESARKTLEIYEEARKI